MPLPAFRGSGFATAVLLCGVAAAQFPSAVPVFTAGAEGYHTFRIPAICRTPAGDLLAFAEGRKGGTADSGDIDLVLKRSQDGGATWGPLGIVSDDAGNTCGNPVPIVERNTGVIILVFTRNTGDISEAEINKGLAPPRSVWLTRSTDGGVHWDTPEEISALVRKPEWRWYATGPGHGIQLTSGRLVVPANHSLDEVPRTWRSHVIYSDDAGATWSLGGVCDRQTNESTVAELDDGRLCINMRNYRGAHRRAVSYSADGGLTWSPASEDPALIEPVCQASLLTADVSGASALFFSNPASLKREKLSIRRSLDHGVTWPRQVVLTEGPAAYSDLVALDNGAVGCLYERGLKHPYEEIVFARVEAGAFAP